MVISRVVSKGKSGQSYTSILLRQSFRVGSKVKSKTLAVLTKLPARLILVIQKAIAQPNSDSLSALPELSGQQLRLQAGESFGAVWTVDQVATKLGLKKALGVTDEAALAYWQVLARVLVPATSLLAMVRLATTCAAAAILGWRRSFSEDDLYTNGTWLEGRQAVIERRLWLDRQQPAAHNQLFLYDVTSSYLEGSHNQLGEYGYNRDGKKGKKQLVVGLLADAQGEPVSIRVYPGNTNDLKTFGDQVAKLKKDWSISGVTLVGDRGMVRQPQQAAARQAGFHTITSLTKAQIRALLKKNVLQLELFDEEICEVLQEDRRYVLRRNPVRQAELASAREQKRQALTKAIDQANQYLAKHPRAKARNQRPKLLQRLAKLGLQGWLKVKSKGRKYWVETEEAALRKEAELDGCYVIQTDLPKEAAAAQTVHDRYKDLALVERDFRTMKSGHLEIRPWFVCKVQTTRAHALTAMLALKVRRELEKRWEKLEVTVEEGLRELGTLGVMQLVSADTGEVVARQIPEPTERQKQLLAALGLTMPTEPPEAKVVVGTRKKIQNERKAAIK